MDKLIRAAVMTCLFILFVLIDSSSLFSQPDLIIDKARLLRDIRADLLDNNDPCYINEGCVGGLGDRQLIRFSTHIRNIGNADFVVGAPPADPNLENNIWEYDLCHQHWHYEGYAQYLLFDQAGKEIPIGLKNGFCLMDSECSGGGTLKYHCGYQGISAGCGDIYGWSLDCQWVDVTDVPSGIYRLVNRVNWTRSPDLFGHEESNYDNNETSICIQLSRNANGTHSFNVLSDAQCNCTDNDGDGICTANDCNDYNASVPATPGTACNDNNANTTNDRILADGCTCQGTFSNCIDIDGDGFCASTDCNDYNPNVPATPGTACNDGNANTTNDRILADGCTCQGTFSNCIDIDGDGFCASTDCNDYNPNVPTTPGTACNDGNANTTNDVILADGCTCQGTASGGGGGGTSTIVCNGITITYGNGQIKMVGLATNSYYYKVHDLNNAWNEVFSCSLNCGSSQTVTAAPSSYKIKIYNAAWIPICDTDITLTLGARQCIDADGDGVCVDNDCNDNDATLPATPGTPCNDRNAATTNDRILADGCTCQGTQSSCTDVDGDGVCANIDCNDANPNVPTTPGTPCNDNNPNTGNDVILADGCTCQGTTNNVGGGTTISCNEIRITYGSGQIKIVGLATNIYYFKIHDLNHSWNEVLSCAFNCGSTQTATLAPGLYKIKVYNTGWVPICDTDITLTGGSGACVDADRDGICAADDCNDNNANIPASPGTFCNDGNAATTNDRILADGCTCRGTVSGCVDVDGDGVCAIADCNDNNASVPATPGTPCNDGNASTSNDVIQADGCTCRGNTSSGTNTGTCVDINVSTSANTIIITGLTAPIEIIKVYNLSGGWRQVYDCIANCGSQQTINNLQAGNYVIEFQFYSATWAAICAVQKNVTVPNRVNSDTDATAFRRGTDTDTDNKLAPAIGVRLYPNPAKETVSLDLKDWKDQVVEVTIYNHLAQAVLQKQVYVLDETIQKIDLSSYSSGLHFVQVSNGRQTIISKLLISK